MNKACCIAVAACCSSISFQFLRVEGLRLSYQCKPALQRRLRSTAFAGLQDAAANGQNANDVGRRVILPSDFIGSPRHYQGLYHDSMAIVAKCGKPDYFITMTCNPQWPEIIGVIRNASATNHPDIVERVFQLKLGKLEEILLKGALGKQVAYIRVIEFQKRQVDCLFFSFLVYQ